jgi:hypothetical protein
VSRRFPRRLLIDPRYQFLQMAAVVVGNILVTILIAGLLSWFYLVAWDGSVAVNHNQRIPVYVAMAALMVTMLTVYCSLRRSRAVAGMMHKLHIVLDNAGEGRLPDSRLAFRKSDYFSQLADPLNRCLDRMRQQQSDPATSVRLRDLLEEIDGGSVDLSQVRDTLAAMIAAGPTANQGARPESR